MKIIFRLAWHPQDNAKKAFKSAEALSLFEGYRKRISNYADCEARGMDLKKKDGGRGAVWFCHSAGRMMASEELSRSIGRLQQSGKKELQIAVGPAGGFSAEDIEGWNPDLLWSFGALTLPHELAAMVAAEQVYRAFTILKGHPYHLAH